MNTHENQGTCANRKRRFSWALSRVRDEGGSVTVEAVIILPALAALYCACFVWFDAFRHNTLSMKATYTISDILSRQEAVSDSYLEDMTELLAFLVPSYAERQTRVSVVYYNVNADEDNKYRLQWSYASEDWDELTQLDLDKDTNWIPIMSDDDSVVVTESRILYQPLFNIGWSDQTIWHNIMVTRPRFWPTLRNVDRPVETNEIDDPDNPGDGDGETL